MKNPLTLTFLSRRCRNFAVGTLIAFLSFNQDTAAKEQTPFKAAFSATQTTTAPGSPCAALRVDIQGSGQAIQLGRFTLAQHHCIAPPSLNFTQGEFEFFGANGDAIRGTYSGVLIFTSPGSPFSVDGQFIITGGSGRFENATGGGAATGLLNLDTGEAQISLLGTISSPGSNKQ